MSFYDIVRTGLRIWRDQGVLAAARFLKAAGLCPEDRRKVLSGFQSEDKAA